MIKKLPAPAFILVLIILLHSCHSNPAEDQKKNIRMHWNNYFIAAIDLSKKQLALGTDSMLITFENRSDYKMDSAFVLFQNQGLFVHHMDTLKIGTILPKGKYSIAPPVHTLGLTRSLKIVSIYSKALEFRYKNNLENSGEDCFHCK